VKFGIADVMKNGIWLALPPLLFSLGLMSISQTALTAMEYNKGIPDFLMISEIIGRILVFSTPALFSVGLSTKIQKIGLGLYLAGLASYCLSYGTQNYLPDSAWSTSMIGFTASAYTNLIWMIGLGLMGDEFYFSKFLKYRPVFFIAPALVFVILHTAHAILYFRSVHS
jgi:hypothetical protein